MSQRSELLEAALGYARQGWRVFPLHTPVNAGCSCSDADCTKVGKHPRTRKGLKDATTDEQQVRRWWSKWPDANIGVLTGQESGLLVVDADDKGGRTGSANLAALASAYDCPIDTMTVRTGSGVHFYLAQPGYAIKNSLSRVADGVDVRAEGGYVVAAPSLHANGKRYEVQDDKPLAEVPDWLLEAMTAKTKKARAQQMGEGEQNPLTEFPIVKEGERNDTLHRLGSSLRGQQGMEQGQIEAILLEFNEKKCNPPMDEAEVLRIAESVCKYPAETKSRNRKSAKRIEQNPLYWFQFNLRDWFADQNIYRMKDYQRGWYIQLIAFAWQNGGFLPADRKTLAELARAKSLKRFEAESDLVLAEFEQVNVGGEARLKHSRIASQYTETLADWIQKKEAGERSRQAWLDKQQAGQMIN